ncbi:hypothetical protein TL16_g01890 [Triparma laevis f. inornata]|uniref:Uncharacterized protein n=2 Tax=Triparma laevis TaxID=1534972 RepID=A0A9W7A0Y8_9STRA|nr:hypothetical protein TL16_g01890 [Triparma laevis f. inornata]GMH62056.1 hypothetical protein TrLO_g8074 [Triparma laevis f. longispina]
MSNVATRLSTAANVTSKLGNNDLLGNLLSPKALTSSKPPIAKKILKKRPVQTPEEVNVFKRRSTKPQHMWSSNPSSTTSTSTSFLTSYTDITCKNCGAQKVKEVGGGSGAGGEGHKAETWGRKDDLKVFLYECDGCGVNFRGEA